MKSWSHFVRSLVVCNLIVLGVTTLAVGQAHAGVPSPLNSSCPLALTVAANGSCCFDVIVRDGNNIPVPFADVVVDFGACPVTFCPAQPPELTVIGNAVLATTDAAGHVSFCICANLTLPCTGKIFAGGVFLCDVPVATTCPPTPNRPWAWGRLKMLYR